MTPETRWLLPDATPPPPDFCDAVRAAVFPNRSPDRPPDRPANVDRLAQLLWQRGWRDRDAIAGSLDPRAYTPNPARAFGEEMALAVDRLLQARDRGERVAIWGDFDADGITATSVLWDGLGQFFDRDSTDRDDHCDGQLCYTIPDRLKDSHGLNLHGLDRLANNGVTLVVTCDTGSTNLAEIDAAADLGIDIIVTDHHTLPDARPNVVAIVNPRSLATTHPLYHLSGVAVAYKLVEALYDARPEIPDTPIESLLDLVAIGLIADLVELKGDCRYLAQLGIAQLQRQSDPQTATRPGLGFLLELCKRSGDRPTDISFGIGPRINAVSRIYGDAQFCVDLLTSHDRDRCWQLAQQAEDANTRRKALQRQVFERVRDKLATIDLSTTRAIVLEDPGWSGGVLGLAAGQIAQEYGRPTILLSRDRDDPDLDPASVTVRGSARSIGGIDLYQLVNSQAHLLDRFGGHPFAAGLSLSLANLPIFQAAIERQLALQMGDRLRTPDTLAVDLEVGVPELGQTLFRELKAIEPCGMGNPAPRLLVRRCWFENVKNKNIQDRNGGKVRYIKTHFELWDADRAEREVSGFPGVWWGHYENEIPNGQCDAVVELDYNPHSKAYEVRLLDVRSTQPDRARADARDAHPSIQLLDWRKTSESSKSSKSSSNSNRSPADSPADPSADLPENPLDCELVPQLTRCPTSWDEFRTRIHRLHRSHPDADRLALAYTAPAPRDPDRVWRQFVGAAKYLSRTGEPVRTVKLCYQLDLSEFVLKVGLRALQAAGYKIIGRDRQIRIAPRRDPPDLQTPRARHLAIDFYRALAEQQFRRRYFTRAPLSEICAALTTGLPLSLGEPPKEALDERTTTPQN